MYRIGEGLKSNDPEMQKIHMHRDEETRKQRLKWCSGDTRKGKIILQQPPNLGRVMGEFPLEFKDDFRLSASKNVRE